MSDGIGLTIAKLKIERDELRAQLAEANRELENMGREWLDRGRTIAAQDRELAALRAIEDSGHDATIHYRKGQWVVGIWINGREDLRKVKADRGHFFDAVTAALAAAPAEEGEPKDGRCDFEVYMNGEVVDVQHMSAVEAEERVNEMRATMPGFKVDWHYVAGRAVFKRLPLAAPAEETET